jgi:3-phosphoshikimate 1-carboxyvinyltransferase
VKVGGVVRPPGDKSISHRALMIASIAQGTSRVRGILDSADTRTTAEVMRRLGVGIDVLGPALAIRGVGLRGLRAPDRDLDCGNSGTTARLAAGIVAGSGVAARFIGDASLSRRPMGRIAEPLRAMGAEMEFDGRETLPFVVRSGALRRIEWEPEQASAQVKSAILLAALVGGVDASVREHSPTRDHTERMLRATGVDVVSEGTTVVLARSERVAPFEMDIPGDPSSAAFLVAAAALAEEGRLEIEGVLLNPLRTGFLEILRRMGASVVEEVNAEQGGEPVGRIVATPGELAPVEVGGAQVIASIDELPLLACVAARAEGVTIVTGASELRVKESDRIAAIVSNLRGIGVEAEESTDGFRVHGGRKPLRGQVQTGGDHRVAMSFGVLASDPRNAIVIDDKECVAVSYPRFWEDLARVTNG